MRRKLRIQYPGAIYHVMNRGERQEPILGDDRDRHYFLETLTEACQKAGWRVQAFCLMSNPFHLVVEGLKGLAWTEEVVRAKCKRDPGKVALARELRSRTTAAAGVDCRAAVDGQAGVLGLAVGPPRGGCSGQFRGAAGAALMTISLTDP
jgi:hypothetical protein